jgi:calcineurin-like phosphoesterase family protein
VTLFVISDTHFGHANILTFRGQDGALIRPGFSSVEEMDEFMVERWNSVVRPSDHVYHLGDVTMKAPGLGIVKRLNGKKRLVRGNHDIFRTRLYLNAGFEEIHGVRVLEGWVPHPDPPRVPGEVQGEYPWAHPRARRSAPDYLGLDS